MARGQVRDVSWAGSTATLELPGYEVTRATIPGDPARRETSFTRDGLKLTIRLPPSVSPADMPVVRLDCRAR